VTVAGSVPIYHVDIKSMQGQLVLFNRGTSKRSAMPENPTNSSFVFSHADVLAHRVEYHAPTTWRSLKANSQRRETINFRLTAYGVQPASDFLHVVVANAIPTSGPIQDGGEGNMTVTGNRSTLIAAALTSGLAVTAAIVAVVAVVVTVFHRRRSRISAEKPSKKPKVTREEKVLEGEVKLPEVVFVAVSNLPPSSARPPAAVVRQPVGVDWSNVDPEILQHCRTTDPVLHSEKVWV